MGLFNQERSVPPTKYNGIRTASAILGTPLPIVIGQQRVSWKLLWYGDFVASQAKQQGGGGSGMSKGGVQYVYAASVIGSVCMGPTTNFLAVWDSVGRYAMDTYTEPTTVGGGSFPTYAPANQAIFHADLGVGIQSAYSTTVNDYGSPGPVVLSGTQKVPLAYTSSPTPNPGEYTITFPGGLATYTFNSAQTGQLAIVNYVAFRYRIQEEELNVIPALSPFQITVQYQSEFYSDAGVQYYPTGTALSVVGGTPSITGTYNPNGGNYLFAPGDAGASVTINYVYKDPNTDTNAPSTLNLTYFTGALGQAPWSYLTSKHPSAALGYSEVAYVASSGLYLGYSAVLPQLNFEILGSFPFGNGIPDACPADAIFQLLTNPAYKISFPATSVHWSLNGMLNGTGIFYIAPTGAGTGYLVNDVVTIIQTGASGGTAKVTAVGGGGVPTALQVLTPGTNYYLASGLKTSGGTGTGLTVNIGHPSSAKAMWLTNNFFISAILDSQSPLMTVIGDWCEAGQVYVSWDEGMLKFIPLSDTSAVGNGTQYTPPTQPVIDLDDNDFVVPANQDPVTLEQTPWQNRWNRVSVRWSVRSNSYNDDLLQIQDEASVQQYGLQSESAQSWQFICTEAAAQFAANMRLQRYSAIFTTYKFTLKSNLAFLSPGDIITITDGLLNTPGTLFGRTPVRITRMTDDPVKGIVIEAEQFPWSVGTALLYNKQAQLPSNTNDGPQQDPGNTSPLIFEVPNRAAQYSGGKIYIFANGSNVNWGGFELYVSFNGTDYSFYGQYTKPARIGITTEDLPGSPAATKFYVFGPPAGGSAALTNLIYPQADGGIVSIPWSADVLPASQGGWETSSGSTSAGYSFTNFDAVINNQLSYGAKSLVVVLSPISFGGSNQSTPNYVFTAGWATSISATRLYTAAGNDYLGSGAIAPGSSAQGVDNTAFPAAWMPAFETAWAAAVTAALNHMKAQPYASKIAYVRVGGGAGGEWFPFATSVGTAGLLTVPGGPTTVAQLQTTWLAYMSSIETVILATSSGFKFVQAVDGGFATEAIPYTFADVEAALGVSNGFGVGCEGLKGLDITAFGTHGTTSGGAATSGFPSMDHAYLFSLGASILQFQTSAASDPTGVSQPGSLVPLLPYATARGATAIELYYLDWQVMFDPSNGNHATYGAGYRSALSTARGGGGTINPGDLDNTDTLTVNMQQSGAVLQSVTAADRDAFVTLSAIVSPGQNFTEVDTATVGTNIGNSSAGGGSGGNAGPNLGTLAHDSPFPLWSSWANPNGILGSSSYANNALNSGTTTTTDLLSSTAMNMNVPTGVGAIVGLKVSFKAYYSAASGSLTSAPLNYQITLGGSGVSLIQSQNLTTTPTTYTFGSATDLSLWHFVAGVITPTSVNDPSFGVQVQGSLFGSGSFGATINVQDITVTVYWAAGGAAVGWTAPQDVASVSAYATALLNNSAVTQWLLASDFKFQLPFGFVASGIEVTINAFTTTSPATLTVSLFSGEQRVGVPKAVAIGTTPTDYTFGLSNDLWGADTFWDIDVFNAQGLSGFGAALVAQGAIGDTMHVNNVRITLFGTSTSNLELISYENATLVGLNTYALSSLRRGIMGSYPCDHPATSVFARMDQATLTYTVDPNFTGSQIFFKFLSFNAYGNQLQSISAVVAYPVPIGGLSPGAVDIATGAILKGTPNFSLSRVETALAAIHGSFGIQNIPSGYGLLGPQNQSSGIPLWGPVITGGGGSASVFNFIVLPVTSSSLAAIWDFFEVDTTAGNVTITLPLALLSGDTAVGVKKVSSDSNTVTIVGQADPVTADTVEKLTQIVISSPGVAYYFASDGISPNWFIFASFGGAAGGYDFNIYIPPAAGLYAASQELYYSQPVRKFTLAIGLANSNSGCRVAPFGAVAVTLLKNGVSIGTINFAGGSTTPTITFSGAVTFNGTTDTFSITAPVAQDKFFAGFWLDLFGILGV